MFGLGTTEIILIVAVLFLLFGASRLPQLAKSLGQSRRAFREGMREAEEDFQLEEEQNRRPRGHLAGASDEDLLEEARRRAALRRD